MSPQAKNNIGFQAPAGRRVDGAHHFEGSDLRCPTCKQIVPTGTAVIVVHFHAAGSHQMFCPEHRPANTRPFRGVLAQEVAS